MLLEAFVGDDCGVFDDEGFPVFETVVPGLFCAWPLMEKGEPEPDVWLGVFPEGAVELEPEGEVVADPGVVFEEGVEELPELGFELEPELEPDVWFVLEPEPPAPAFELRLEVELATPVGVGSSASLVPSPSVSFESGFVPSAISCVSLRPSPSSSGSVSLPRRSPSVS